MNGNKDIQGSASVSRDVTIGGNASVKGELNVERGLKVSGWFDAPNIKGASKGMYSSVNALRNEYPHPEPGWWAIVGESLPARLYLSEDGEWIEKGEAEIIVDSDIYNENLNTVLSDPRVAIPPGTPSLSLVIQF